VRDFIFPHECGKFVFLGGLPVGELYMGKRLRGMVQLGGTRRFRGRLRRRGVCTVQRGGGFLSATMYRIDGRSMYANFDLTRRSQRGGE
jgi:hypothetical protein